MNGRAFIKMHGLGNDFVVIDARQEPFNPTEKQSRLIADRRFGIGCDQFIIIEPAVHQDADIFMRIRNADGGEVGACGNATRCIASLIMQETARDHVTIETLAGLLHARQSHKNLVTVDMGPARLEWQEIPLAEERDTLNIGIKLPPLKNPVGVNMGNPHAVFFVEDAEAIELDALGPRLEHHPLFPERANIGVATLIGKNHLRLRVFERGVGITSACGTGACAAAVAAARRGLTDREVQVDLDGGSLHINWLDSGQVLMTGPVSIAFRGEIAPELLNES
ncbi:diaminopimelate epimerase [Kiloniella laminariae]|uniref:Diaminopimelate epimerase n=1 Tax=Kiloniella laminariae TaxID=454162 RepID=A0ABT4LMP8_9PROT|nr:diaminopimelate epimerase [Kiloniella laminariae]MCZ4282397.1 diaminopimelate epimerase [Kiloniella laminariae]